MSNQTVGLYIGKFQPFHNGHLFAVTTISPTVDSLIIVIGSSQYHGLKNQPFSAQQRRRMIEQTLAAEGIKNFSIVEVPDIHDSEHWVEHVRKYVKQFDVVFTNSELVQKLFSEKGFTVKPIKVLPGVSGTLVRHKIAAQESDWLSLVSTATARVIIERDYADTGLATRFIQDKPGTIYKPHSHERVFLFTLKGAALLTLDTDTHVSAEPGKEIVIADNQVHSAIVGKAGWSYIFAATPEEMKNQGL